MMACRVCGKSLQRSDQKRILGDKSCSLSSANATEFLKFVDPSIRVESSCFVCRQPCFASLEKGHRTLHTLTNTVNSLRAQLGLSSALVAVTIPNQGPLLQHATTSTLSGTGEHNSITVVGGIPDVAADVEDAADKCTPKPKARRSLSFGTPKDTRKAHSLKVHNYDLIMKWKVRL